jgi:hypothetical protein
LNSQEYPHEYLINKAHDHVRHAKAQRALASQRISEAKAQASNNHDNRRFVFLPFYFLFFIQCYSPFLSARLAIVLLLIMPKTWVFLILVVSSPETLITTHPYFCIALA